MGFPLIKFYKFIINLLYFNLQSNKFLWYDKKRAWMKVLLKPLLPSGPLDNQNADWLIIKITQILNTTMAHIAVNCHEELIDLSRIT